MEPLSLTTRRLFATFFFFLFIIILPVIVLYASGYRLQGFSLVTTGGIYIATPVSGVVISLNGEEIDRSSIFSKSFFFDNLEPGSYVIQTALEGYAPWSKTLVVESRIVTDVSMLAVLQPLTIFRIEKLPATSTPERTATSTVRFIPPAQYARIAEAFATSTASLTLRGMSTSTTPSVSPDSAAEGGVRLIINDGDLFVQWMRHASPPGSFCIRPSLCAESFGLESGESEVVNAQFFGGGVIYQTMESGVFFVEVDIRQPRLLVSVATKPETEYRVFENSLYIKDGDTLYTVEGL